MQRRFDQPIRHRNTNSCGVDELAAASDPDAESGVAVQRFGTQLDWLGFLYTLDQDLAATLGAPRDTPGYDPAFPIREIGSIYRHACSFDSDEPGVERPKCKRAVQWLDEPRAERGGILNGAVRKYGLASPITARVSAFGNEFGVDNEVLR